MPKQTTPFVHLHFHTGYSLLDGATRIDQAMEKAAQLGMPANAITDHGVLYGTIEFYKKAKAAGVKPILGCEVYMAHGSMHERKTGPGGSQSNHLVLLAENEIGFKNLQRMVSKAHLEGFYYKPRIDKEMLAANSEGIIGLSACLKGEVTEAVVNGSVDDAVRAAGEFVDILGPDNFFIEIMDHGIPEQKIANRGLLEVARRTNLPLIASNDVHYLNPDHAEAHDCMICLQTSALMSDPNRMKYGSDQFFMKTGDEMLRLFPDHPQALSNTLLIAERCNVELNLGGDLRFPKYDIPEGYTDNEYLWKVGTEGLRGRYGIEDVEHPKNEDEKIIADRFKYEFGIIDQTGFNNYFLVVWDFIRYAREQRIPVGPGRGSGAGSILAYALGITNIDPLQYNLIFERFLNPERISPPDFDIDFCQTRRGEVIEYVKNKYGRENVAQIITFGTLGAKTVIRDVGRVLEVPFSECDKFAKLIPEDPSMTLEKALKENPDFKTACQREPNLKRIMKYARVLEGLPRQPGTHAAGVVIGPEPLTEMIPLARDKNHEPVTQYEMKPLEETGMVKMDFLGLKTLTVIQEAVDNVKKRHGIDVDMDNLPMDDAKTFELLNRGATIGVFQVESKGMRDLLRRFKLTRFEDLIAMIALYRPGPMNMLDDFVKRKHNPKAIKYDHPLLEPILQETYGVMLYQEQVQQAANSLAGFSLGQGDILRRAMGKKIASIMAEQRGKFVEGCIKTNNIPRKLAEKIFKYIDDFAGYGFNKSHSAAYAVISYQTAYLKAHYPAEFMAALCSLEIGNADKLPVFTTEARDMGIEVLPPYINESDVRFAAVERGIRFGLAGIKNVGVGAVEALVAEREANGPFTDLMDFCSRLDNQSCNRKALESLIKCGAFDFCGMTRGRLFENIDFALSRAASAQRDRASGQGSLFDMLEPDEKDVNEELPDYPPWPKKLMLAGEKELIGFYISGHPLDDYIWTLDTFNLADCSKLEEVKPGTTTRIGGLITQFQKRFTRRTQEPMAVFVLEHLHGSADIVVFPDAYRTFGQALAESEPVMVCGEMDQEEGIRIKASEVYALDNVPKLFSKQLCVQLPEDQITDDKLAAIRDLLAKHPGELEVRLYLKLEAGKTVITNTDRMYRIAPCTELIKGLEALLSPDQVSLVVDPSPTRRPDSGKRTFNRRPAGVS